MKKTTNKKMIENEDNRVITRVKSEISDDGKSVEVSITSYDFDEIYPIVEASKLSLNDSFLLYEPETENQKILKKAIIDGINSGLSDFRHPAMDPAENGKGNYFFFDEGNKPADGNSFLWWHRKAREFMPQKNSRLGIEKEYDAFLAVIIKYLVEEENYEVSDAWKAVCDDSTELGHYANSANAKGNFEPTGSRKIGKWFDLANQCKFIAFDEITTMPFIAAGGCWSHTGNKRPLSCKVKNTDSRGSGYNCVGWIVMDV